MKINLSKKYVCMVLLSLAGLTSCNSFLNEVTDNQVTNLDDGKKLNELLVSAYTNANYRAFMEYASDNVGDTGRSANSSEPFNNLTYTFSDYNSKNSNDTTVRYWYRTYRAILYANIALETIEKLGNPSSLNSQRGEALISRAYHHFMLASIFGYRYEPNSTALGIKYMKQVEKNDVIRYKRETISQNFEDIKKDLDVGLPLVTDDYTHPKFHFNKDASYAFATRFYLHLGDWDNVIKYADLVLNNKSNEDIVKGLNTRAYQDLSTSDREKFHADINAPQTLLLAEIQSSYFTRVRLTNKFGLTASLRTAFTDINLIPFTTDSPAWVYRIHGNGVTGQRAYYLYRFEKSGSNYVYIQFTTEEVLFNRAEAYAMKNNFPSALSDIKVFLGGRLRANSLPYNTSIQTLTLSTLNRIFPAINNELTPFYDLSDNQRVLIKAILEYRKLEFTLEGMRWLDIKRFNIIVTHETNGVTYVLGKDDPRRAFQIPELAIATGMKPNPR